MLGGLPLQECLNIAFGHTSLAQLGDRRVNLVL
jgi:hypothetical protein